MRKLLLCTTLVALFSGCAKLSEDMTEERIKRPKFDTEIPINPPWDSIPQPDNQTGG